MTGSCDLYQFRIATGSAPGRNEGVEPMGRGRAKAKQTKVARELKYSSGGTDLDRLAQELAAERGGASGSLPSNSSSDDHDDDDDEYDDPYAEYGAAEDDEG